VVLKLTETSGAASGCHVKTVAFLFTPSTIWRDLGTPGGAVALGICPKRIDQPAFER
jgi:hypothetical protein